MKTEIITEHPDLIIRRLILQPGEATFWHRDSCHRFSVVVRGEQLAIEYQDASKRQQIEVQPGMADWDAPESRIHRAVNTGSVAFEEVVTFYRADATVEPQPRYD